MGSDEPIRWNCHRRSRRVPPARRSCVRKGDRLMTTDEVADLLQVSRHTLPKWRIEGGGPPFVKFKGHVRYSRFEVLEWLETHRRTSTSDPGGAARCV